MQPHRVPPFAALPLTPAQIRDLRSNHAGESGAVAIYHGILATARAPALRDFAREHLRTEQRHLSFFNAWLPRRYHSRLLPLWRAAGWLLGALPALCGAMPVFRTIAAVESFVEKHYLEQIDVLVKRPEFRELAEQLQAFCDDEVAHRDDAMARARATSGAAGRAWAALIGFGSAVGVAVARRV